MTPAQIAHIMSLVDAYMHAPLKQRRAAIEAALRDAPQAEPPYAYIYEWDGPFGVHQSTSSARYNGMAPNRSIPVYLAATPSAATAVEPNDLHIAYMAGFADGKKARPAVEPRDERAEFEAHFKHLDFTMDKDGWGRPVYAHPHVYSLWVGWQARAAVSALKGTPT